MNGIAERINRTLMNLVRSMLKDAKLPKMFWAEAVTATPYIRDRVGHSSIKGDHSLYGLDAHPAFNISKYTV